MSTDKLKALLQSKSPASADDVRLLATSISSSFQNEAGLALLALSKVVDASNARGGDDAAQAQRIKDTFDPLVSDAVAQGTDDPEVFVSAVSLLAALAPLAPAGTVALLTQPLGINSREEASDIDPLGVLLELAELPSRLQPALAALLSALAGTKAGRGLVRDRAFDYLSAAADTLGGDTGVLCAVALSKLGRPDPQVGEPEEQRLARDEQALEGEVQLARTLMSHIKSSASAQAILPTLEGLSVLSTRPAIRDVLCSDAAFLKAFLALSPVPQAKGGSLPVTPRSSMGSLEEALAPVDAALCFGIATVLAHLVARKPVLSEHDQQMERLRRMAISGKTAVEAEDEDPAERDDAVEKRVVFLLTAGVIPALSGLVRAESPRVRDALARICLGLVEDRAHRAPFIRDGGFKVLTTVLRSNTGLAAPQALAKLVITTPPQLLFPPPLETNALNAFAPLYLLLVSRDASLLQQFESLMALTNLASINGQFGARIVDAKVATPDEFKGRGRGDTKVIDKVEELMLDDNNLVRRAATELVCNLVNSEAGYAHFSGEAVDAAEGDKDAGKPEAKRTVRSTARLGVLLLLTDVDDLPTRLAASGALAVLTESATACAALCAGGAISGSQRSVWDRLGDLFEPGGERPEVEEGSEGVRAVQTISSSPPDVGLAHRGAVIVANLLEFVRQLPAAQAKAARTAIADSRLEDRLTEAARALAKDRQGEGVQVAMMLAQTKKLFVA
ncbi:hypothetical protein CC85DRAFT_289259 [Cutaneotrichosporon oleaginosum]|uniref:UNC-45/Cro1/She4 central domain-containing protein n=1 Tax=Cutaneotrichosporon oleaginosum TaxID=879819 RepID=A0A0J1ATQ9_9TREE|nr:uncharacterized protein CC85DRAFT_289259 [Cutaneotrichosporon oleaginosum]KLT38714.1 hypothetical protein CC85DRAFT_289259 [Cutaneotrichosporon oleaginosum]TXT15455.1 hypothetical protein COLE_01648 [Cutaneotrichosporon oleaginosum]